MRQLGLPTFHAYLQLVRSPSQGVERQTVIDLLTTNETYFFREPRHFDLLRDEILPARNKNRTFRAWSAASSSGEEAYTLAMVLAEALGTGRHPSWEVLGSDISQRMIERARKGVYPRQRIDGIPAALLHKYCHLGGNGADSTLEVDPALRGQVSFRRINLNERLPDVGQFDVVFLRNMLIYFQSDAKAEIVRRIIPTIVPGGWLLVGHSETLKNMDPRLLPHAPSVYRIAQ